MPPLRPDRLPIAISVALEIIAVGAFATAADPGWTICVVPDDTVISDRGSFIEACNSGDAGLTSPTIGCGPEF